MLTILSSFDVRFKGLQSCQWLSSDTSPAINCELKASQTFCLFRSLRFSITQEPYRHFQAKDLSHHGQRAKAFSGPVEGETWMFSDRKFNTAAGSSGSNTHTQTNKRTQWWREMSEDGWPGQGDMIAEWWRKTSNRQTNFPSTSQLISGGLGERRG